MNTLSYLSLSRSPNIIQNDPNNETGQGILEYALIFSFVVVLLVVLLYYFGDRVRLTYEMILATLPF